MPVRYFALLMGIAFILAGVGGFIPGITAMPESATPPTDGYLLGLFPINAVHNLVHLSFGIWGVLAYREYASARAYARGLSIVLGIFTVMGLLPLTSTTFGLMPLFGHDIWLHALEAVVAFYLGFIAAPVVQTQHV
jgi:hypothetical protein